MLKYRALLCPICHEAVLVINYSGHSIMSHGRDMGEDVDEVAIQKRFLQLGGVSFGWLNEEGNRFWLDKIL